MHPITASYWERELPPAPPPTGDLPSRVDVLIVGAGFMGRWLAYFLGRLPHAPRVLVIERDRFGLGASTRNAGFLTSGNVSELLADSRHAGMQRVVDTFMQRRRGIGLVRQEFPQLVVNACGSTDYDELTDESMALIERLNAASGEALFSVRESRLGSEVRRCAFNHADGALHPVQLLRLLQEHAKAGFAFGVRAEHVADGVAHLATQRGAHELRYSRAFVCVNGFARELDADSPVVPGRGQAIVTSVVRTQTAPTLGYINQGYDYFRFVDGRLLVGGGRDRFKSEATAEINPTPEVRAYLEKVAARVIGHRDWQVEHHWAGIMGFVGGTHLGGNPRRKIDAATEAIAGFGGMGVALTPVHAHQVAIEFASAA